MSSHLARGGLREPHLSYSSADKTVGRSEDTPSSQCTRAVMSAYVVNKMSMVGSHLKVMAKYGHQAVRMLCLVLAGIAGQNGSTFSLPLGLPGSELVI